MENINKLTGKKISEEMNIILEKLKENETVDLDEINKSPEIIEAYEKCDSGTATNELPGREEIRKKALEDLTLQQSYVKETGLLNGFINKDKRVDIVIGLPAAGKSSALVEPISNNYKSRIIDADEAKKLIPEYNEGWGASRVHRESKLIIDKGIDILRGFYYCSGATQLIPPRQASSHFHTGMISIVPYSSSTLPDSSLVSISR